MYIVRFVLARYTRGYAGEDCVTTEFDSAKRFHDPVQAEKEIERWTPYAKVFRAEVVTEDEEMHELGIGNE